jgi:translocation and assembly module TamB
LKLTAPGLAEALRLDEASAGWDLTSSESGWNVNRLTLESSLVQIEGAGALRDPSGASQLDLKGTLNLDWDALTSILAKRVEPDARIAGRPLPWRVSASIAKRDLAAALDTMSGELGVQVDELDVFGMRLGRTALVARVENGKFRLDPIDSTLNQGKLHVEPELARDENGVRCLRLGKSSRLEGAVINDEVSHRILAYAAPVLDGATRVQGRVSTRLSEAIFPITAKSEEGVRVEGELIFDNVRFMPGELADQLLAVFDNKEHPLATLRDSVSFRIENRKVHQKGLLISVADLASIELDGSVDFDKNLDLTASLGMSRRAPIAGALPPLLQDARFDLPIRGTMQKPVFDTSDFKERLAKLGKTIVNDSVEAGLNGLDRVLRGKALKGLGDFFLPRLREMSRPPGADNDAPNSDGAKQTPGAPKERRSGQGEDAKKDDTDGGNP